MNSLLKSMYLCALFFLSPFFNHSQEQPLDIKYKRSSLYSIILSHNETEYIDKIKSSFINTPIPDKFNNHITKTRAISFESLVFPIKEQTPQKKKGLLSKLPIKTSSHKKEEREDLQQAILNHLDSLNIAKSLIEKWFNRSKNGGFNMNLIVERGLYNASDLDVKIANQNERGKALLADAGEALIKNSFVIVNDFKYTNKEEIASKAKGILSTISTYTNNSTISSIADAGTAGANAFGKGYIVKTTAYLYKLVWNDEVATIFYNDFWNEDSSINEERKKAFDETDIFKLKLVGIQTGWADVQSTFASTKSNEELIEIATVRATDNVIAKLQRKFEVFRTKTPLLSGDPLSAKIGLKEDLEKGDKYEVLEQVLNKDGLIEYKRIGVITVDKEHIWDNRHLADEESSEESDSSKLNYTTFKGSKNKYFSGMLIRQIN